MVKDMTKFTNAIWGVGICLNVCVCTVFHTGLNFGRGVTPKFGFDMEGVYSTKQLGGRGTGGHAPPDKKKKNRCSEIDSEAFWGYL